MITSKQLLETIYKISRYSDFKLVKLDELLLINQKSKKAIRFVKEKQNVQSLDFLIQKTQHQIKEILNFNPVKIDIYLINQPVPADFNNSTIKVHSLSKYSELRHIDVSRQYQVFSRIKGRQSENYYYKRLMADNDIDRAMSKFSPVTTILIVLNVLIFLINLMISFSNPSGNLIEKGGLSHFNFVHGEYYRVFTSIFLHFDFSHILLNMLSLYIFGKLTEYLFGPLRFLLIYLISGLIGNLLSLSFETTALSAGASGAITGLLGALFVYMIISKRFEKKLLIQTAVGLLIFLLMSNLFGRVNNWAHFGGLFGGFFVALMFKQARLYFYMMTAGLALIIILLLMNTFSQSEENIYNHKVQAAMVHGDFKEAESMAKDIFAKGYEDADTYRLYGLVLANNQSLAEGIATWQTGLKRYPESAVLNYQMALAMRANDDYKKAQSYFNKAEKYMSAKETKELKNELKVFGE
ncbi:rhomboid family intramembrane serine protease [Macrococcus brunensis]|uniref:rhomboid family intramembrane serine protease n=1 Tax=Macrococcus brunensis TaxID=198483 RepID=UPI001EF08856|nr:rhomboid family intramembrane serine protease [Macrococcus brunensis]ULG71100.1 rhomboid family intramembrane serine protease [Macrococcus brunensis]